MNELFKRGLSVALCALLLLSQTAPVAYAADMGSDSAVSGLEGVTADEPQTKPDQNAVPKEESAASGEPADGSQPSEDGEQADDSTPPADLSEPETDTSANDGGQAGELPGEGEAVQPGDGAETDSPTKPGEEELPKRPWEMSLLLLEPATVDVSWYQEDASSFEISSEAALRGLAALVAEQIDFKGKTISLTGSIALTEGWKPIGSQSAPFRGSFDGCGSAVAGLQVDGTQDYQGLFGYTDGGEIANLTVAGTVSNTGKYTGAVVGYAQGTRLLSCVNRAGVTSAGQYTGGVAGYTSGRIEDCVNEAAIQSTFADPLAYVGGVAGYAASPVRRCANTGTITAVKNYVGGIIGLSSGAVENCLGKGAVIGGNYVGGIAGKGNVWNSFVDAVCTKTNSAAVAVGAVSGAGTVENCYSTTEGGGQNGTYPTQADLLYGRIAYRLNAGGDAWSQSGGQPTLGGAAVRRIAVKTLAEGVTLSFAVNGTPCEFAAVFAEEGEQALYAIQGSTITVTVDGAGEGFHFSPALTPDAAGTYTLTVDRSRRYECGNGKLPGESAQERISWYIGHENDAQYTLLDAKQLYGLAQLVNGSAYDLNGDEIAADTFSGKTITLAKDIDLSTVGETWQPIGRSTQTSASSAANFPFKGVFDGAGHTISGLQIEGAAYGQGLFGFTIDAELKNITVEGTVSNTKGYTGGIVGYATGGTISGCTNKAVVSDSVTGSAYLGGVAGYVKNGVMQNCANTGTVTAAANYTGGVAGYATGSTLEGCTNGGTLLPAAGKTVNVSYWGGVVGYTTGALTDCVNTAALSFEPVPGTTFRYLGGIVGRATGAIDGCENRGEIRISTDATGRTIQYVGGVAGYAAAVTDSANRAGLTVATTQADTTIGYIGGVAGMCTSASGCINSGAVTGTAPAGAAKTTHMGGIVGSVSGAVNDCFATGAVTGTSFTTVGGLFGSARTMTSCYSAAEVTGGKTMGAIAGTSSGTLTACYAVKAAADDKGVQGEIVTEQELSSYRLVWALNTAEGSREYAGIWKQGASGPEPGAGVQVYRVQVLNYSSNQVQLSFMAGETPVPAFADAATGIDSLYTAEGTLKISASAGSLSGFSFRQTNVTGANGTYQTAVSADMTLECGYQADLEANTGEAACIKWYTDAPDALSYTINTEQDFWGLGALVSGSIQGYAPMSFSGKTLNLDADLDLSKLSDSTGAVYVWTPIGTRTEPFSGTFNGNGKKVFGWTVAGGEQDNQGLFGYTKGGTIRGLTAAGTVSGRSAVGGIVGYADGTAIETCTLDAAGSVSGASQVGGIVGCTTGTLKNCASFGAVAATGEKLGGIAGQAKSVIACIVYRTGAALGAAGAADQLTKCFYLSDGTDETEKLGTPKTAQDFTDRVLAYELDTVSGAHSNSWQMGEQHPTLGEHTVCLLEIQPMEGVSESETVKLAEGQTFPVFTDGARTYAYVMKDETARLAVTAADPVRVPVFYPAGAAKQTEDGYVITMGVADLAVTYRFGEHVVGDIAWYTADSEKETFELSTEMELRGLASLVNGTAVDAEGVPIPAVDFTNKKISLTADIPVKGGDWVPIGAENTPFRGTFRGGEHMVSGYEIHASEQYQGLFGYTGAAKIFNLKVSGSVQGKQYTGGLVGYLGDGSALANCVNLGDVTAEGNVGGIAGYVGQASVLSNCKNEGTVRGTAAVDFVGGVAGLAMDNTKVMGCSNSGAVTGGKRYTAGVIGNPYAGADVSGCSNTGVITGAGDYTGGVIGGLDSGVIQMRDCWNSGAVTGGGNYVGGVAGDLGRAASADSLVSGCYNTGAIASTASSSSMVTGGVFGGVGFGYGENFDRCYNTGSVTAKAGSVGGIAGNIGAFISSSAPVKEGVTVHDCYNIGDIAGGTAAGGILGAAYNAADYLMYACFSTGDVSGTAAGALQGKNIAEGSSGYYLSAAVIAGTAPTNADRMQALDQAAFSGMELPYLLNTRDDSAASSGIWAQGDPVPTFAIAAQPAVYRISDATEEGGSVLFAEDTSAPQYFEVGAQVSFRIVPEQGKIVGSYTLRNKSGVDCPHIMTESENVCTITLSMPEHGLYVGADFIQASADPAAQYTVTLKGNGGSWSDGKTERTLAVTADARLSAQTFEMPVWSARGFTGWYLDAQCTQSYNPTTAIQANVELYAGWQIGYIATFDAGEGAWENPSGREVFVAPTKDANGNNTTVVTRPQTTPVREGYVFVDWYADADCLIAYDFSTVITGDVTLYAGWTPEGTYQVIFDANGGRMSKDAQQAERIKITVPKGETMRAPQDQGYTVTKEMAANGEEFTLRGWYTAPKTGRKWSFDTVVSENMTLYVHWDGDKPAIEGGTPDQPMGVEDLELLIALRDSVNSGTTYETYYFELTQDITLPEDWEPIGKTSSKFMAYIKGNGYTMTLPAGNRPLFGQVSAAEITDLNIYGEQIDGAGLIETYAVDKKRPYVVKIEGCTIKSGSQVRRSGFLGGYASGSDVVYITNCTVESGVVIGYDKQESNIGAISGDINGYITGCVSYADVYGVDKVGGIAGSKGQSMGPFVVQRCYSGGTVTASGNYAGGIVGSGYIASSAPSSPCVQIMDCGSTAAMSGSEYVGGILGAEGPSSPPSNGLGYIQNCFWAGDSIASDGAMGGIVGFYPTVNTNVFISNNYFADPTAGGEAETAEAGLQGIGKVNNNSLTGFELASACAIKPAAAFANGEVSYLLDGGAGEHRELWTLADGLPKLGAPSYYRTALEKNAEGGTAKLIGNNESEASVYQPSGTMVKVEATPSSEIKITENADGSTTTTSWKLSSVTVKYANGDTDDITKTMSLTTRSENAVVTAVFEQVSETKKPSSKPDKPSGGNGSGNGTGTGTGNGTGAGTGTGTGTGETGTGTGNAGEGSAGTGDHNSAGNTGNKTEENASTSQQHTTDKTDQSTSSVIYPRPVQAMAEQEITQPDAQSDANEGAAQGGSQSGSGLEGLDTQLEEDKNEPQTEMTVFEIVKQTVQDNPLLVILMALIIAALITAGGIRRYRRSKKNG